MVKKNKTKTVFTPPLALQRDLEKWDAELERDSEAGRLDFLIEEAKKVFNKK
ncbi:hypothetical protein JW935_12175 [candidate division KSB1 bacterium]|nr:hypothetical protein [candidate division KSB1 bacterium]